ncbi:hypothetical protein [Kiloniella laminariae]|uniref:hypothetical protein n=1 Tax=Kiloniella laminariae TaxID=454162 RepID=UPI000367FDB8|nr:hypothetical protein [Kiloniella laminariae]
MHILFFFKSCMVLMLLSIGLSGCGRLEIATVTLTPTKVGTRHVLENGRYGVCHGLDRHGRGSNFLLRDVDPPDRADPSLMVVGYENYFLQGADPFPCHHWGSHAFQAMMLFDVESTGATHIMKATLSFDIIRELYKDRLLSSRCEAPVARIQDDWYEGYSNARGREGMVPFSRTEPGGTFSSAGIGDTSPDLDVTHIIRWMLRGANRGVVLNPKDDEILRNDQNVWCVSTIENPRLVLEIVRPIGFTP